jgi:hypothetical protein
MIMFTPSARLRRRALATAAAVALVLGAGRITPAAAAGNLCISMADSNGQVAGIQVDLKWDSACMSAEQGAGGLAQCTADPATGKQVRASVRPGPTLKTILFSMTDTNPIGDGNLFCCSFTRSGSAGNACCGLTMGNILGSDSVGKAIPANDFTLVATMDGQACAASEAGSGGQAPVRSGLQGGGGGVVAPPAVSGGAPAAAAPQAPAAAAPQAPAAGAAPAAPAAGIAPAVPGVGGLPAAPGAAVPAPEAPSGMDQVQRALEQFRGAPTPAAEATTPAAIATPERTRAAGTPTAKSRATEAHGTPTAAAKQTPGADKTPQATPQGTAAATPQATPKPKPKHHKHKKEE